MYKHIKQREEELGKLMRNELKPAERVPEHLGGEYKRVLKPLKDRVLENLLRKFGALPPMNVWICGCGFEETFKPPFTSDLINKLSPKSGLILGPL